MRKLFLLAILGSSITIQAGETGSGGVFSTQNSLLTIPTNSEDFSTLVDAFDLNSSVYSLDIDENVTPIVVENNEIEAITDSGNPVIFIQEKKSFDDLIQTVD